MFHSEKKTEILTAFEEKQDFIRIIGFLWFYTVYPGPFIPGFDPMFYWISLVAAILIMIPICLMLFFW